MAVSKLWAVHSRLGSVIDYVTNAEKTMKSRSKYSGADYQALKDVIAYAADEEKTEQEFFCQGINCNATTAREQFVTVKQQFGKTDGVEAYHGYLSFKEHDITPELAQKVGMEFAGRVWGKRYQVVVTTHLNTKHLHCHFVVNSVSFVDGKKLHGKEKAWFKFRLVADEICRKYGLFYNPTPNRSRVSSHYYKLEQAGMPTPHNNIREAVDYAISCSRSMKDFEYLLTKMGYEHCLSESRKYWTIKPRGRVKAVRMKTLGREYTNERIRERIRENATGVKLQPFQKAGAKRRSYLLLTREDRIKKTGGLYGLYLHYCYRLGYLPKYRKQNPARMHYLLRDDLIRLDELTAQTRLLGKHHIKDMEALTAYRRSVAGEIENLAARRTHLRKKIRRMDITDERLHGAKNEISEITQKLRELRREEKLCMGIAARSDAMQRNLSAVIAEEEKTGKEKNRNEQQR